MTSTRSESSAVAASSSPHTRPGWLKRILSPSDNRDEGFFCIVALIFLLSVGGTIYLSRSMSGEMPMPGGWTMSMVWMKMPGQNWAGAAAMFVGMWVVMMVAMMLPSLVPTLISYRHAMGEAEQNKVHRWTVLVGTSYFLVWTGVGGAAYALGTKLTAAEMRSAVLAQSVPAIMGVVLLLAGVFQLTSWKARRLLFCRRMPVCTLIGQVNDWKACQHGLRLGIDCFLCCAGFMAILLAESVMNLGIMAFLAVLITVERLVPRPAIAARAVGVLFIVAGAFVGIRALAR